MLSINIRKLRRGILDPDSILFCVKRVLTKKGMQEVKRLIRLAKFEGRLSQKEVEIVGQNINVLKQVLRHSDFYRMCWDSEISKQIPSMVKRKEFVYLIEGFYTNRGYLTRDNDLLYDGNTLITGYRTRWHIIWAIEGLVK